MDVLKLRDEDKQVNRSIVRIDVTLAITGASGSIYGLTLLEQLVKAGKTVALVVSDAAVQVARHELEEDFSTLDGVLSALRTRHVEPSSDHQVTLYSVTDWFNPLASGSTAPRQMVICPCSMGTLGAIAHGSGHNLIHRAADVVLKEKQRLILLPREMPYSTIHLTNMTELARAGAMILPLSPSFYQRPQTIADLVQTVVDRVLHHLDVPSSACSPWYSI